ncbi:MAG: hypothetical protein ACFFBP_02060 [Promethearchaeota archaeon]
MPIGMFLVKWDQVEGGMVWLQYPKDLDISINAVQQIQISHNFIESYITIQEKGWNSISYYNEKEEVIIVLMLNEFDDSRDYMVCIEAFNNYLGKGLSKEELIENLDKALNMKVFRTTDEVITKLSNEWSNSQMRIQEIEANVKEILDIDILSVKGKIILSLVLNSELSFKEIRKIAKTSKKWTENVLNTLIKNKIIGFNSEKNTYFLAL